MWTLSELGTAIIPSENAAWTGFTRDGEQLSKTGEGKTLVTGILLGLLIYNHHGQIHSCPPSEPGCHALICKEPLVSFYDAYGICGDQATIAPPIMKQPSRSRDPVRSQSPSRKSHRTLIGGFRKKKNKKKEKNNKSKNKEKNMKDEQIAGKKLFKLLPKKSTKGIAECESMTDIDSCIKIDIDFDILKDESDLSLDDSGVVFKHRYTERNDDDTTTCSYETDDMDSALFLYTNSSGYHEIDGSFNVEKPKYIIDN